MPVLSPIHQLQITDSLADTSRDLEHARRMVEEAELALAEAEEHYLQACKVAKASGVKTSGVEFTATNGIPMTSTLVDGTGKNSQLDEAKFAKKVGAKIWKGLVKEVLDNAKFKAALAAGIISSGDVAMCTVVGDRKSYARFTAKTARVKAVKKVAKAR